jgi:hypothetical protein
MTIPRIVPPSLRLCVDIAREARAARSIVKVMHNRIVMLPRKAANEEMPRVA